MDKFSLDELMIRVMPGGFLLTAIFFVFDSQVQVNLSDNLDFLYTFIFFCLAFILGELLQTIAHEIEWIIDVFFKFRRPSEVFLYKNNPILNNEHKRNELLSFLNLTKEELGKFQKDYSNLPALPWQKTKADDSLSQSIFWRIYFQVNSSEEIRSSNRNYLFNRVIMTTFLMLNTLLIFSAVNFYLIVISLLVFFVFLWRSRGLARGLVFKTVLMNLRHC